MPRFLYSLSRIAHQGNFCRMRAGFSNLSDRIAAFIGKIRVQFFYRLIWAYVSVISAQPRRQLLQRHLPLSECEMLQRIAQKKLPMRNAACTIYCAELVLSRITRWRYRNL